MNRNLFERRRLLQVQEMEVYKLDEELSIAAEIQRRLLPQENPQLPNYRVVGFSDPCMKIGGDYYDFVQKNSHTYAILIADVSGKGISAALLMAYVQATIRSLIEKVADMQEMIGLLNELTYKNTPPNKYLSLFYCELDIRNHALTYINAGHNPPILMRSRGRSVLLTGGGPVIGLISGLRFRKFYVPLEPIDLLLLYTDGVTERTNRGGEEFGMERLYQLMRNQLLTAPEEIAYILRKEIHQFCPETPCSDDVTAVILKRVP